MTSPGYATFQPSHEAPDAGMAAWDTPDGTRAPVANLDPRLPVQVLEQNGAWSKIACENGWMAWVDGRLLLPYGAAQATAGAASTTAGPGGSQLAELKRMPATTATPVALGAAAAVLLGSFLPWWTIGGSDANAWDIPVVPLLRGEGGDGGVKTGLVLLVVALVALPLLLSRPVSGWVNVAVGGVAANLAGTGVITARRVEPHLGVGIGLLLCLAGGVALILERFLALRKTTLQ